MAKTFYRKRRSSFKRKSYARIGRKTIRKARRRRRFVKAMPSLKYSITIPCRKRYMVRLDEGTYEHVLAVHRFYEYGDVANHMSYNQTTAFIQHRDAWEQFAIKGVSVKYTPSNVAKLGQIDDVAGTGPSRLMNVCSVIDHWTDPDTLDYSTTAAHDYMMQKSTFKTYDPSRGFRQYVSNAPIAKVQKIDWANTKNELPYRAQSVSAMSGVNANTNKTAATLFYRWATSAHEVPVTTAGVPALGVVDVTWYITFRGMKDITDPN